MTLRTGGAGFDPEMLAAWEAWLADREARRTAASVAATLGVGTASPEHVEVSLYRLVLEVEYMDACDATRYRRVYADVDRAKRGTAVIHDEVHRLGRAKASASEFRKLPDGRVVLVVQSIDQVSGVTVERQFEAGTWR